MKKLKLFPKIFIYTLALLLLITMLASGTIYLLAPMMGEIRSYQRELMSMGCHQQLRLLPFQEIQK